jgi:hypothetical protein
MHDKEPGPFDQGNPVFKHPPAENWGFDEVNFEPEPDKPLEDSPAPTLTAPASANTAGPYGDGKSSRLNRTGKAVFALVGVAVAFIAIGVAGEFTGKGRREEHQAALPAHCAAPSPIATRQVNTLFDDQQPVLNVYQAANANGLSLGNNNSVNFVGRNTATWPEIEQVVGSANAYLSQYGMNVQPGTLQDDGKLDFGLRNPSVAELSQNMDASLQAITEPFQDMPIELARLTGIKNIILMANNASNNTETYLEDPHTIVWNIDDSPTAHEMTFALYQGLDDTECGLDHIDNDPSYAALNGQYVYGSGGRHQGLLNLDEFANINDPDPEDYQPDITDTTLFQDAVSQANSQGNSTPFCQAKKAVYKRITIAGQGDFDSVSYDKADLGSSILTFGDNGDDYSSILNPASPILENKTKFLLARLFDHAPQVVKYIAEITSRPDPNPYC